METTLAFSSAKNPRSPFRLLVFLLLSFLLTGRAFAQDTNVLLLKPKLEEQSPLKLSLNDSVELAVRKYPKITQTKSETERTKHEVSLARTEYLPRVDLLFQELRATQNVTEGTILPQFLNVIPIQSGKPRNSSSFGSFFGSNTGLNFSWELIDFGRRNANVRLAKQAMSRNYANENLTKLDVALRAANCYLQVLMAEQQIAAWQATLERMNDWAMVVHTLCDKGLRPGVDAFRADAEISSAKISLYKAYQDAELSNQELAEAMGMAGKSITTVATGLISKPKSTSEFLSANLERLEEHPLALLRSSDIEVARARLRLLEKTWYPHLWYESAVWGRGSGNNSVVQPLASGVVPKTANWGVGLTLQFPVMQYFQVKAKKNAEKAQISSCQASYELAMQQLIKEDNKAKILLHRAGEIADETHTLVKAAQENQIKARERYRVGLTNIVEVAEAERLIARAQAEDAEAQLKVWQAMLFISYARGDLTPFLRLVNTAQASN